MQAHLIAFAPLIVLAGTGLLAGGVTLAVSLTAAERRSAKALQPPAAPQAGAEIIYFPAANLRRPAQSGPQAKPAA